MESALEHVLMSFYKEEMISFMDNHPEYFEEAIQLAVSDKQPYSWRAAWLLWSCMKENDRRVQKHIKTLINAVTTKNDGHQRELLKILSQMELKEEHEGLLFNISMNLWEQIDKNPSVRLTALKFIIKIVKKHPELSQEIYSLTQEQYLETLSPGAKKSTLKLMKELTQ
jgi:hypothetical protein